MQQLTDSQSSPETPINENFDTLSHVAVYGKRQPATTGLVWGYYGGRWGGFVVAEGTFSLTASTTNYIVVAIATGVTTCSATDTNWNDTASYLRVYKIVTSGSAVVGEPEDHRAGTGGIGGGGGGGGSGGVELKGLTFTSDTGSTADSDPGAGLFKWDNATQGSATFLYFDNLTLDAVSLATFYASLGGSGFIYLQQADDATKWQLWKWTTTPTNGTGYYKFPVSLQASGGSIVDNKTVYADFSGLGEGGDASTNTSSSVDSEIALFSGTSGKTLKRAAVSGIARVTSGVLSASKVALTEPATGSTLTVADGKTLTANNSLTLAGTDGKTLTLSNSLTLVGTDSTTMTFPPASASIGYLDIPQNSQSAAYTAVLADAGKHILHPSADTSARVFTIPANSSVAYPVGTAITFVNQDSAGVITISITSDTMRLAGAGTPGSRTLASNGVATAIKLTSTEWIISGTGLT